MFDAMERFLLRAGVVADRKRDSTAVVDYASFSTAPGATQACIRARLCTALGTERKRKLVGPGVVYFADAPGAGAHAHLSHSADCACMQMRVLYKRASVDSVDCACV